MEATVGLLILLYKVVVTFDSMDEILWCDHSYESYCAVLSSAAVYCAGKFLGLCVDKIFLWSISLRDDNRGVKIIVLSFHWFNIFQKNRRGYLIKTRVPYKNHTVYGFYKAHLKWSEDLQFAKILHSFLEGLRHGCLVYFVFRELKSNGKREFVPSDQVSLYFSFTVRYFYT